MGCPVSDVVYLNNRHYDPTTGIFVSVDPLVTITGEAYIYGAANPITYSDASGLCVDAGCWDFLGPVVREMTGQDAPGLASRYQAEYNHFVAAAMNARGVRNWSRSPETGGDEVLYYQQLNFGPTYEMPVAGNPFTWSNLVTAAKYGAVGAAAVVAAGACPATAGLTCALLAGAGGGALSNSILSEAEDCINGSSCAEFSLSETAGDALDGALVGGPAGVSGKGLALALGSDKGAVGVYGAYKTYGAATTLDALIATAGSRAYISGVGAYADATLDYLYRNWYR